MDQTELLNRYTQYMHYLINHKTEIITGTTRCMCTTTIFDLTVHVGEVQSDEDVETGTAVTSGPCIRLW